ncbi:tail assembly protein [Suttonella ornithocola]|uniref:Phage-related protein, tail component n=1 Tax=Suttonella ornithocola TaxID=279832 RepID=A0A380MV67_9GAMM|nr:tail assembly protein [Suttonella ornithocola]SUO95287.1 Phage-related protein, tail component [Suttonella ornithocola]
MATIKLYGSLAAQYGEQFDLAIDSAAEGIRALCCQLKGFQQALTNGAFFMRIDEQDIEPDKVETQLHASINSDSVIHLVPEFAGGGRWGQIILGVVLVVVGVLGSEFGLTPLVSAGIAMIAGGVMQLLMKPPSFQQSQSDNASRSTSFTNLDNISPQGAHVPVAYGYLEVGSVVVSQSIESYDLAAEADKPVGTINYRREYFTPVPHNGKQPADTDDIRAQNYKLVEVK